MTIVDSLQGRADGESGTFEAMEKEVEEEGGVTERGAPGGWFPRLAQWYIRRRYRNGVPAVSSADAARAQTDRAQSAIRRACVKSALTGAAAGTLSTAAAFVTAETEGLGGVVAVPAAAVSIGGEMLY